MDEQLVDGGNFQFADQPQIDPHSHAGQQVQRLFGADRLCGPQNAERPADPIVQRLVTLANQELAGLPFIVDQHRHDVADHFREFFLGEPQGDLIADLIEVTRSLRAFTVESPHGQINLLQALEDLLDLSGDHQRRQVQHHAHPHARADVRGTGGEIAQEFAVGVGHSVFDQVVQLVDLLPGRCQIQSALHHLDPQVILLVDHYAKAF